MSGILDFLTSTTGGAATIIGSLIAVSVPVAARFFPASRGEKQARLDKINSDLIEDLSADAKTSREEARLAHAEVEGLRHDMEAMRDLLIKQAAQIEVLEQHVRRLEVENGKLRVRITRSAEARTRMTDPNLEDD